MAWTCPECRRSFGRKNQSHVCAPGQSVDDYFADRPPVLRKTYDAIARYIAKLDAHVDAVTACVMFKRARTFAEVRAKRDRLDLYFLLSRTIDDPRIHRTMKLSAYRTAHVVQLMRPSDVDRVVREWLAEAYACSPT